jgi:hypothetical protein
MGKTLIHVRHALFEYFMQEDTLDPEKQANLVEFDCEDAELKAALIVEGLKELEKAAIVTEAKRGGKTSVWALNRPLGMYEQNISVGYDTALAIADIINSYCEKVNNKRELCDGSALKERDLQKLVLILESFDTKK